MGSAKTFAALLLGAAVVGGSISAGAQDKADKAADKAVILPADKITWEPVPRLMHKGAEIAYLAGDPGRRGIFIARLKLPANYDFPAQWHARAKNVTVISGTLNVGTGDKLDKSKGEALGPGGFFHIPARTRHYMWTTGDAVIEIAGEGPFDLKYVDPADDPSRS